MRRALLITFLFCSIALLAVRDFYFEEQIRISTDFIMDNFDKNGSYLAIQANKSVEIYNLKSNAIENRLDFDKTIRAVKFSIDGKRLAILTNDKVKIFNVSNNFTLSNVVALDYNGRDMEFISDEKLYLAYKEGIIEEYALSGNTIEKKETLSGLPNIYKIFVSPDKKYLLSSSGIPQKVVNVVNLNNMESNWVNCYLEDDGDNLFVNDSLLIVKSEQALLNIHTGEYQSTYFPDDLRSIKADRNGYFSIWNRYGNGRIYISDNRRYDKILTVFDGKLQNYNDDFLVTIKQDYLIFSKLIDFQKRLNDKFHQQANNDLNSQQKDQFESNENYINRLRGVNADVNGCYGSYLKKYKVPISDYDYENRSFKIDLQLCGIIIVKVEENPEEFKKQELNLDFLNVVIAKEGSGWKLLSADIVWPNASSYIDYRYYDNNVWDSQEGNVIPPELTNNSNPDAVAVILFNYDYQDSDIESLEYAKNDAELVKQYFINSFGIPESKIRMESNLSKLGLKRVFDMNLPGSVVNSLRPNESDLYIYYSGHGIASNNKNYLVPYDFDFNDIDGTGYSYENFFYDVRNLPVNNVYAFFDACRVSEIGERDIIVQWIDLDEVPDNLCLITSCKLGEKSFDYDVEEYGLFTYYLMRAIKNRNADKNGDQKITIKELYDYISDYETGIPWESRRLKNKEQTPILYNRENFGNKVIIEY